MKVTTNNVFVSDTVNKANESGHISRVFHKYMGKNIKEYVNKLRYNELQRLKAEKSDTKLCDLIFASLQSYYRFEKGVEN